MNSWSIWIPPPPPPSSIPHPSLPCDTSAAYSELFPKWHPNRRRHLIKSLSGKRKAFYPRRGVLSKLLREKTFWGEFVRMCRVFLIIPPSASRFNLTGGFSMTPNPDVFFVYFSDSLSEISRFIGRDCAKNHYCQLSLLACQQPLFQTVCESICSTSSVTWEMCNISLCHSSCSC